MNHYNFLPWREARRRLQYRQVGLFFIISLMLIASVIIYMDVHLRYDNSILRRKISTNKSFFTKKSDKKTKQLKLAKSNLEKLKILQIANADGLCFKSINFHEGVLALEGLANTQRGLEYFLHRNIVREQVKSVLKHEIQKLDRKFQFKVTLKVE